MNYKFICRRHAAERFFERFGKKYGCKNLTDANSRIYTLLLKSEIIGDRVGVHKYKTLSHLIKRAELFNDAHETKHYVYFKKADVYFVTNESKGLCEVMTCLNEEEITNQHAMLKVCDCLRKEQNGNSTRIS